MQDLSDKEGHAIYNASMIHICLIIISDNSHCLTPESLLFQAYQMDCYFRQSWVDQRLRFSGPLKVLPVSVNILERLWKPDTHFLNGQRSYLHMVTTPNKLLRINQDGRILYSMRYLQLVLNIKYRCMGHDVYLTLTLPKFTTIEEYYSVYFCMNTYRNTHKCL